MASMKEPENSRFIHSMKRMRTNWNNIVNEEGEGNISKQPYSKWLTLGIGPCREDGSDLRKDSYGKGKVMAGEKKGDSNWLTLKIGSGIENESRKLIYAMEKGESVSCRGDGSNKEAKVREDSNFVGQIAEDTLNMIFCKLPLPTLFQAQAVCTSWQTLISNSVQFHNMWEQSNKQMWLVMDLYDDEGLDFYVDRNADSNGFAIFDFSRRMWYRKMFNDEWRGENSKWCLRAGDGGLLVYSNWRNGLFKVINPLTMETHYLEDVGLSRTNKISHYMKEYHHEAVVHFKFDPESKTYQVFVIMANDYVLEGKNLVVLIYRSAQQKWFLRWIDMGMKMDFSPRILLHKGQIFLFSEDGQKAGIYNRNGNGKFFYLSGMQRVMQESLGIVICKGRMIMVCRGEAMELPPYTHTLSFYEFDEGGMQWASKYEAIVSPQFLGPHVSCVGGDYIWITEEDVDGYITCIFRIDIDNGEVNEWPGVFEYNGRGCVSMRLSFSPCS